MTVYIYHFFSSFFCLLLYLMLIFLFHLYGIKFMLQSKLYHYIIEFSKHFLVNLTNQTTGMNFPSCLIYISHYLFCLVFTITTVLFLALTFPAVFFLAVFFLAVIFIYIIIFCLFIV